MWKRDDAVKPTPPGRPRASARAAANVSTAAPTRPGDSASSDTLRGMEKGPVNIGKSVVIKGELTGSEDLTIEGHVEGKIELRQNVLTIGPNGKIKAQVFAKSVVILGEVTGNVTASEKVDLRDNGSVDGDIAAPRVAIAEGAHFRGSIDMQRSGTASKGDSKAEQKRKREPAARRTCRLAATRAPPVTRRHLIGCGRPPRRAHGARDRRGQPVRSLGQPDRSALDTSDVSDLLKFGGKRPDDPVRHRAMRPAPKRAEQVIPSKALPKFISALSQPEAPVLIDFGPVIGTNVAFFGEHLGCKLFIEDLERRDRRHTRARTTRGAAGTLAKRFTQADASVDGVLCWDIFDFLERRLRRRWRGKSSGWCGRAGRSWVFSARRRSTRSAFTKYEIVEETSRCAIAIIRGRRPEVRAAEPRHHQDVRRPDACRNRSCSRATRARSSAPERTSVTMRPVIALPDRLRHARSLRRHDEGRDARDLPRRDAGGYHPRHPGARRDGRRAGTGGGLQVLSRGNDLRRGGGSRRRSAPPRRGRRHRGLPFRRARQRRADAGAPRDCRRRRSSS